MPRKRKPYQPVDLRKVRLTPRRARATKVSARMSAGTPPAGSSVRELLQSLPDVLAARDLRAVIAAIAQAHRRGRPVVVAMGAHVIKCGCSPLIADLIDRGIVSAIVMHGAGAIHDYELAVTGRTSEDVTANLADGTFGMVRETGDFFAKALDHAWQEGIGLGRAVGETLRARHPKRAAGSLLAVAAAAEVPATVHVALGTDTIHAHPAVDPALLGAASGRDFSLLCAVVADLRGGVWLNLGSAVVLPEVFLKALSVARNLGHRVDEFVTANLDMQRHYRTDVNVVQRPTPTGYHITGHHEIMLPLLRMGVLEALESRR